MIEHRSVERPAFWVIGRKTWIGGQDNAQFGQFWEECRRDGLLAKLADIAGKRPGPQTGGAVLGVSLVAEDPAKREFYYMIAVEQPVAYAADDLESYQVPASRWEVFECWGEPPDSIVASEMYAFMEWLPASGLVHANAPEMEVYSPTQSDYSEFWLPVREPSA